LGGGLGRAYRLSTEFILLARRGVLKETETVRGSWFNWKRLFYENRKPKHSAKPPEFFEIVERVTLGPRLELFARSPREGWDVWGKEVHERRRPRARCPISRSHRRTNPLAACGW
jgi:N6-adenosine-specific RNA methylase IME4